MSNILKNTQGGTTQHFDKDFRRHKLHLFPSYLLFMSALSLMRELEIFSFLIQEKFVEMSTNLICHMSGMRKQHILEKMG